MKDIHPIERLVPPVAPSDLHDLAALLLDAVQSGAAVSFLGTLTAEQAQDWWRAAFANAAASSVFLVTRDAQGICGTVQLHAAWAPNQPHRAEVVKLLVHRRSRGAGLGTQLMQAVEAAARNAGFSLITLDAKRGAQAEQLYRKLGWVHAGTVPRFAFNTDGVTLHDAVIYYKELTPAGGVAA
jgi:GNAT superfamily N-acetyltransferase